MLSFKNSRKLGDYWIEYGDLLNFNQKSYHNRELPIKYDNGINC